MKYLYLVLLLSIFLSSCITSKQIEITEDSNITKNPVIDKEIEIIEEPEIKEPEITEEPNIADETNVLENPIINKEIEIIEEADTKEKNEEGEILDKAYGPSLQKFINELLENPDILKNEDCNKHEKEVKQYCIDNQKKYLEIINNKND